MDISCAVKEFEAYLDHYDRDDDKIRLKITHTYGVMDCSRKIAQRMKLSGEDTELAQLIALLHDIGRFEQIRRFDSFEPGNMNHAKFGEKILFEEGMIRKFIREETWDEIIRTAIARHSDFRLEGIKDERTLLHAKLIRDADKLDNCRVKIEDPIETFMGAPAEDIGTEPISRPVIEQFRRQESILSSVRKTKMDYWVSYLAYFFDMNYPVSFSIVQKEDYVSRIIRRIPYSNPETAGYMKEIWQTLDQFIGQHCLNQNKAED